MKKTIFVIIFFFLISLFATKNVFAQYTGTPDSECEANLGFCSLSNPNTSAFKEINKSCASYTLNESQSNNKCFISISNSCTTPLGCISAYRCDETTSGACGVGYVCCTELKTEIEHGLNSGELKLWKTVFCNNEQGINTAIGCIPVSEPQEFIAWILRWAMGIGGGISFFLIIVASFQIMTSSGNPEKIQAGKELLTSAITGLIMLIFSVFILKIIGIDILNLPGIK